MAASAKADAAALQPRADQPAALPILPAFAKVEGDKGPNVLTLTNTSKDALSITVVVVESVRSHYKPTTRKTTHALESGKSVEIDTLAAHDEVTVSAEGFAPLKLTVQ